MGDMKAVRWAGGVSPLIGGLRRGEANFEDLCAYE
jgi:hypothetical protein